MERKNNIREAGSYKKYEKKYEKKFKKNLISKKKILNGLRLFLLITVIAITLLLVFTVKHETFLAISKANIFLFLLSFVLIGAYFLTDAFKIIAITKGSTNVNLSLGAALTILLTGSFMAAVTPFQTGGLPLEMYIFNKNKVSIGKSGGILIIRGLLYALFVFLLLPFLLPFLKIYAKTNAVTSLLFYSLFIYAFAFGALVFLLTKPEKLKNWLLNKLKNRKKISGREKNRKKGHKGNKHKSINKNMISLINEIMNVKKSFFHFLKYGRKYVYLSIFLTFISLITYYAIAPLLLYSLGFKVNLASIILIQLTVVILTFFFPTPGASGAAEFLFAFLFMNAIPSYIAGLYSVLWRFVVFYIPSIIGGVLTLRLLKKKYK